MRWERTTGRLWWNGQKVLERTDKGHHRICFALLLSGLKLQGPLIKHKKKNAYRATRTIGIDRQKPMKPKPYRKNFKQLRNAESKETSSPPGSTPIGHVIPNGQPWKYTCKWHYVTQLMITENMNLKNSIEGYFRDFGGRKGKGETNNIIIL